MWCIGREGAIQPLLKSEGRSRPQEQGGKFGAVVEYLKDALKYISEAIVSLLHSIIFGLTMFKLMRMLSSYTFVWPLCGDHIMYILDNNLLLFDHRCHEHVGNERNILHLMTGVGADHHLGRVGRTLPTLRKGGAETEARNGVVGTIPNRFRRRTQNPGHSPRIAILYQVSLGLGQSLVPEASEENQPLVTTRTDIERGKPVHQVIFATKLNGLELWRIDGRFGVTLPKFSLVKQTIGLTHRIGAELTHEFGIDCITLDMRLPRWRI